MEISLICCLQYTPLLFHPTLSPKPYIVSWVGQRPYHNTVIVDILSNLATCHC